MFRFSIRDLLWLTLVVAVGLGWLVREQELRAHVGRIEAQMGAVRQQADEANERANAWRVRTGALEAAHRRHGRDVVWHLKHSRVDVGLNGYSLDNEFPPTLKD